MLQLLAFRGHRHACASAESCRLTTRLSMDMIGRRSLVFPCALTELRDAVDQELEIRCDSRWQLHVTPCYKREFVPEFILSMLAVIRVCQSRSDTALEILALRQQVAVLKRKRPHPVCRQKLMVA